MLFTWVAVLADYFFVLIEYGGLNSTVSYMITDNKKLLLSFCVSV